MAHVSTAYDFELFSDRKPQLVELKNTKKVEEDTRRRAHRQSVFSLLVSLAIAAVAIALVGYFITCNVRLTEMNKALKDKQSQLSALQSEEVRLKSEVAGLTSAEKVNSYVQENGLGPVSSNQIYYIEAQQQDQVVVPKEEGNWFRRTWNAVVDFLT